MLVGQLEKGFQPQLWHLVALWGFRGWYPLFVSLSFLICKVKINTATFIRTIERIKGVTVCESTMQACGCKVVIHFSHIHLVILIKNIFIELLLWVRHYSRSYWCNAEQKFVRTLVLCSLPLNVQENILTQYQNGYSRSEGNRMLRGHWASCYWECSNTGSVTFVRCGRKESRSRPGLD